MSDTPNTSNIPNIPGGVPTGEKPLVIKESEILPIQNDSGMDRLNKAQKDKAIKFYEQLAQALPLEGRDYRVDFIPGPNDSVRAVVEGLNELGRVFAKSASQWYMKVVKADKTK